MEALLEKNFSALPFFVFLKVFDTVDHNFL